MKNDIIVIDLNKWITSAEKARELGISRQAVHGLIKRKTIESWKIPELGMVLVPKKIKAVKK